MEHIESFDNPIDIKQDEHIEISSENQSAYFDIPADDCNTHGSKASKYRQNPRRNPYTVQTTFPTKSATLSLDGDYDTKDTKQNNSKQVRTEENLNEETEASEDNEKPRNCTCVWNEIYIRKYWDGRIKLAQAICTFLSAILLSYHYEYYHIRFIFFRVVTVMAFFSAMIDLLVHLFTIWDFLPSVLRDTRLLFCISFLFTLFLLIGSSLVVVVADIAGNELLNLVAGLLGFLSMILFGVETSLHCIRYRSDIPVAMLTG